MNDSGDGELVILNLLFTKARMRFLPKELNEPKAYILKTRSAFSMYEAMIGVNCF